MPIPVQLYPNTQVQVYLLASNTYKIYLRQPNNVIQPLPRGTIELGTLYASNSIVIGNTSVNSVINSTAIDIQSIFANGSIGAAGEVLHSNGSSMYWSAPEQNLLAGNGLTSNTTHYEVLANTGIVANSTGIFVNSAYIATLDSNNSIYLGGLISSGYQTTAGLSANVLTLTANDSINLGGQPASYYTNATNLSTGTVDFNRLPANIVFWSNTNTYTAVQTYNANINVVANSTAQLNFGNNTVNAAITSNDTHVYFTGTAYEANNADYLDGYDISNILAEIDAAYTNATNFSSNATNITSGTVNEVLLPYRMDQDVRTTDNVIFNNATISGNLIVIGSSTVVQGNTTTFVDNMLYLNQGVFANITNITSDGTYVTFYANTNYQAGWDVYVSGVNPSSYNGLYTNIFAANSTAFRVANSNIDFYISGGTARGKTDSNPDLGIAAGYNDGTYHHTGIFRDASDGIWKVFEGYDPEPDASIYINTSDPSFQIANFQANFLYLGNTSTNWVTANQTGIYAGTTLIGNSIGAYGKTEGSLNVNSSLTANNSTYLNGELASYYTNATNLTTGTLDYSRLPANVVIWSNTNSYTAVQIYNANLFVNVATLSVGNTTSNVTANTTTIKVGNASVNISINSTSFSGTANNATNFAGLSLATIEGYITANASAAYSNAVANAAAIYQTTAGLSANVATLTANDSTNLGGQPASYYTNATNITSGTLNYSRLPANAVFWSNTNSYTAVQTFQANVILQDRLSANGSFGSAGQVLTSAGTGANVYWADPAGGGLLAGNGLTSNTTHYEVLANSGIIANSTGTFVNTSYIATLTANDSTNLGGQPASYYTNATNISTGTLNYARLPANVVIWSNTNSYTAVQTYNANLFVNTVTLSVGNTTSNVTVNTTTIEIGNSSVSVTINSTAFSGTSDNITGILDYSSLPANVVIWSNTNTFTDIQIFEANLFVNSATLSVGNTNSNTTINSTSISVESLLANGSLGNSGDVLYSNGTGIYWDVPTGGGGGGLLAGNGLTSNTTHYEVLANSGIVSNSTGTFVNTAYIATLTSNNSTNLGGQPASYYTNATNISTGTLNYSRLPANVVIWSNTNTYTAVQTYNANLVVNSSATLTVGNASVNTFINSTAVVLKSLFANGSIGGVGELLASNGTGLYWTTPPSGSFSNGTTYTWSAPQIFQANVELQNSLSANGSFGSAGQVLTSAGSGANVYWATPTGGGGGLSDSYETVNKNLKAYDATYAYSGEILQTITYSIPPSSSIVKTFNYTGEVLTSIVLSGATPGGIELTKTFGYTSGVLTSVTYT